MKAITVYQPWTSLIVEGLKPYEFRRWPPPDELVGQRIAIHAAARPVRRAEIAELILALRGAGLAEAWTTGLRPGALAFLERVHARALPLGAVLGTATLGRAVPAASLTAEFGGPADDARAAELDWEASDRARLPLAWPMRAIEPLRPPVPAHGAQGFWEWNGP